MNARPRGPYVIGAVGGSGTRLLAAIVRQSGMWIGANLNGPLDALDFADYCARWIRTFAAGTSRPLSTTILHQMRQGLNDVVERHLAPVDDANAVWGWKNSGSLHLLRFLHDEFPRVRFLHLVRDGRDMAYSPNQYQLRRYGNLLLTPEERRWSQPLRSIAVWSRLNLMAADYAGYTPAGPVSARSLRRPVRVARSGRSAPVCYVGSAALPRVTVGEDPASWLGR